MSTLVAQTLSNGTVSTSTANCIQGSAKAWVNFNGTGTVAIRGSYNVSSITDVNTGFYTINFTTAMPDANYGAIGSVFDNGVACFSTFTTSSVDVYTRLIQGASGPVADYSIVSVSIFR